MANLGDVRRSRRDWALDCAAFAFAVGAGVASFGATLTETTTSHAEAAMSSETYISPTLLVADLIGGSLCCLAVWLRRRWPAGVALLIAPIAAVSTLATGAAIVAIFGLAVRRPFRIVAPIVGVYLATIPIYTVIRPETELGEAIVTPLAMAAVVGFGMYVRARRELLLSLAERAERAEAEQALRVEQARHQERVRIAREMHDVLGHRLSLLSLQAGALEYGRSTSPEEATRAAGVIREGAHQALEDLREVIGVLREDAKLDGGSAGPEPPQPTLTQLLDLLEESRRAGMELTAEIAVEDLSKVPTAVGRHAYRIVQEGLTNARKHAEHSPVEMRIAGSAGIGLEIELRNRVPLGTGATPRGPGTTAGLLGLGERATLAGGRLEHGPTPKGDFRLWAWLPWPP
jgi:signal transduction histidine kinase